MLELQNDSNKIINLRAIAGWITGIVKLPEMAAPKSPHGTLGFLALPEVYPARRKLLI